MNENLSSPVVSVIIPCFNAEKYLAETINSVIDQTFKDLEIIVIDDGSTDQTPEIIKSYGSSIIGFHWENKGASAARNKGTELARGEFLQYLDADDLLAPEAIEKKVYALKDSGSDVAYSGWQKLVLQEDGSFILKDKIERRIEDTHQDPEIAIFKEFWAPPASLLYSRSIVDKIGSWNESLPVIQDARFLLDAALFGGSFIKVPGVSAYYRVHDPKSLSRCDPNAFIVDIYNNSCQVENWWRTHNRLNKENSSVLAVNYDYTARHLFESDYELFKDNLQSLYKVEPEFKFTWPKVAGLLSIIFGYKVASLIMKYFFPLNKGVS